MDVFLMIRRKKSTFFLDAKENTTVFELKRMIEGITKKPPGEQKLYNKEDTVMTSRFFMHLKQAFVRPFLQITSFFVISRV